MNLIIALCLLCGCVAPHACRSVEPRDAQSQDLEPFVAHHHHEGNIAELLIPLLERSLAQNEASKERHNRRNKPGKKVIQVLPYRGSEEHKRKGWRKLNSRKKQVVEITPLHGKNRAKPLAYILSAAKPSHAEHAEHHDDLSSNSASDLEHDKFSSEEQQSSEEEQQNLDSVEISANALRKKGVDASDSPSTSSVAQSSENASSKESKELSASDKESSADVTKESASEGNSNDKSSDPNNKVVVIQESAEENTVRPKKTAKSRIHKSHPKKNIPAVTVEDTDITIEDESLTAERKAVTEEELAVTVEDKAVTAEESAVTSEDKAVTAEEEAITVEEIAVTVEKNDAAAGDKAVTAEERAVTAEEEEAKDKAVSTELDAVTVEDKAVTAEERAVTVEEEAVTVEDKAVTAEEKAVTSEDVAITVEDNSVTVEDKAVTAEEEAVTSEDKAVTKEELDVTVEDKAVTAEDQAVTVEEDAVTIEDDKSPPKKHKTPHNPLDRAHTVHNEDLSEINDLLGNLHLQQKESTAEESDASPEQRGAFIANDIVISHGRHQDAESAEKTFSKLFNARARDIIELIQSSVEASTAPHRDCNTEKTESGNHDHKSYRLSFLFNK